MIIVDVKKEKNLEVALRSFKNKIQKTKLIQQLRDRKEYIKPSIKKRDEKLKSIYSDKIKNGLN
jgi:small subunit ribosomal protein S21